MLYKIMHLVAEVLEFIILLIRGIVRYAIKQIKGEM